MSESGKWTDVEYTEIDDIKITKNSSNGKINVSLRLSPLDVPIAWRHSVSDSQKVMLEFKYLSEAESTVSRFVENIAFELGKNSKRVYRITLDIPALAKSNGPSGEVSIELVEANAAVSNATATLELKGDIKKPNAKAILNVLGNEATTVRVAAG